VAGSLVLQGVGAGWLALIADPGLSYGAMTDPLVISGVGVSLAIPSAQNAVFGSLPPDQMGKASGANSMLRELGGGCSASRWSSRCSRVPAAMRRRRHSPTDSARRSDCLRGSPSSARWSR
jgi:hypothetical protein